MCTSCRKNYSSFTKETSTDIFPSFWTIQKWKAFIYTGVNQTKSKSPVIATSAMSTAVHQDLVQSQWNWRYVRVNHHSISLLHHYFSLVKIKLNNIYNTLIFQQGVQFHRQQHCKNEEDSVQEVPPMDCFSLIYLGCGVHDCSKRGAIKNLCKIVPAKTLNKLLRKFWMKRRMAAM